MKNNKIYNSFSDSVKDIKNGSSIMIGGFGGSGLQYQNRWGTNVEPCR